MQVKIAPGVVKDNSTLASEGRWSDADKVRFRDVGQGGLPELMGGQERATEDAINGKARALVTWDDLLGIKIAAIGTHKSKLVFVGGELHDITPIVSSGDKTSSPLSATAGLTTVTVTFTAHGSTDGSRVHIHSSAAVGNLTFGADGTYATARLTAAVGSNVVYIKHTSHGRTDSDFITLAGTSAVGGIGTSDLDDTHRAMVLTDDDLAIQVPTTATSSEVGGGAPTYTYYDRFSDLTVVDDDTVTIEHGATASTSTAGGGTVSMRFEEGVGLENATNQAGFGTGTYSQGYYSLTSAETDLLARVWHLSPYGQELIGNYGKSKLFRWRNNWSQSSSAVGATDAPQQNLTHWVTPARFLCTGGTEDAATSTFNPMLVAWATQEGGFTSNDFTPVATNTAGDWLLQEGSKIVRGLPAPFVTLVFTDSSLYTQQYLRDTTFVFGFQLVAPTAGLIGANAVARLPDGRAVWLSMTRDFYIWSGGVPQVLPCPVREWMLDQVPSQQESLIFAGINSRFSEVIFFFPDSTNECAKYVCWNYAENHWTTGTWDITAWADRSTLEYPLATHAENFSLQFQEKGHTDNGNVWSGYVETASMDMGDGEVEVRINGQEPDIHDLQGTVDLTVYTKHYNQGTERTVSTNSDGNTLTITSDTNRLNFRATGQVFRFRYASSAAPSAWRVGRMHFDMMPTGMKR